MTAPNVQRDDQELRAGVRRLIEANVPEDEVAAFIKRHSPAAPNNHERFRSGELKRQVAEANARDKAAAEAPGPPTTAQKVLGGIGSVFPIGSAGERLQTYARMAASRAPVLGKLMGGKESYDEALDV